jgi:hypothetical protein
MISFILTIIGIVLVTYVVLVLIGGIFKVGAVSSLVGFMFIVGSAKLMVTKWWAMLIQFPFLILYALLIRFEGWNSVFYILFLQILVSVLIFNLNRIKINRS